MTTRMASATPWQPDHGQVVVSQQSGLSLLEALARQDCTLMQLHKACCQYYDSTTPTGQERLVSLCICCENIRSGHRSTCCALVLLTVLYHYYCGTIMYKGPVSDLWRMCMRPCWHRSRHCRQQ